MLTDELELVNSLTSTLASFKEDCAVGGNRHKPVPVSSSRAGREDHHAPHSRDPDVWPPPTPVEPRLVWFLEKMGVWQTHVFVYVSVVKRFVQHDARKSTCILPNLHREDQEVGVCPRNLPCRQHGGQRS